MDAAADQIDQALIVESVAVGAGPADHRPAIAGWGDHEEIAVTVGTAVEMRIAHATEFTLSGRGICTDLALQLVRQGTERRTLRTHRNRNCCGKRGGRG